MVGVLTTGADLIVSAGAELPFCAMPTLPDVEVARFVGSVLMVKSLSKSSSPTRCAELLEPLTTTSKP